MTTTYENLFAILNSWTPPEGWKRVHTLDVHSAGEPLRVFIKGFPELPGDTILSRRRWAREHHDQLRTALMWEPRGHREMYGCVVTPPVTQDADFGVIFLHNEGYSTMCGHGIIAIATVAVHTGLVNPVEPETCIRIDTPAGLVTAYAHITNGAPDRVRFRNVPSFVAAVDQVVPVPGFGDVRYDLAFGGAFYAYVDAAELGFTCIPEELPRLVELGMKIKQAIIRARPVEHPFEKDLGFLYGIIFVAPPIGKADSRNVCIFADGEVDRSPTGTGVSGRMALHYAKGEITTGESMVIESIIGTTFTGRVVEPTKFGPHAAVIPEVEGSAHITGRHEFLFEPGDPLQNGFFI